MYFSLFLPAFIHLFTALSQEKRNRTQSVPFLFFSWVDLIDVFMATNNVSVNSYTDISTTDTDEKSISTFFTSPY